MFKSLKVLTISLICLVAVYFSPFFSSRVNAQYYVYRSGVNSHNTYNSYAMGRRTVMMSSRSTHPYYRSITTPEYYEKYKNKRRGRLGRISYRPVRYNKQRKTYKRHKRQNRCFRRNRPNPYFSRY